jgi:transposase
VASDVLGVSGRAMLEALVGGTTDPEVLADLARGSLRNKLPALREALQGRVAGHHRLLVAELLAHLDYLDEAIQRLSGEVAQLVAPFSPLLALLCTIPGVERRTAEVILTEIGVDMTRFPTAGHLASWAGCARATTSRPASTCSGKTRTGSRWLRTTLSQAANAAARSKGTSLAAHYARIKGRRGHQRAIVAVAHSILVIAWHLLTRNQPYTDLGGDSFLERQTSEAYKNRLVHQLERMGHKVTLEPAQVA